jgi:hypothetical protein
MSVARSSGVESEVAEIITPDSACTALRVEATRVTVWSCVKSSDADRDNFTTTSDE